MSRGVDVIRCAICRHCVGGLLEKTVEPFGVKFSTQLKCTLTGAEVKGSDYCSRGEITDTKIRRARFKTFKTPAALVQAFDERFPFTNASPREVLEWLVEEVEI